MRTPYIERDVDAVRDGFCLYKCVILVLSVLLTLAVAHLTQEGTVPRAASPAGDETCSAEFNDGVYGSSIIWHHNRPDCCTQAGAGCMDMIGPLIHLIYGGPA